MKSTHEKTANELLINEVNELNSKVMELMAEIKFVQTVEVATAIYKARVGVTNSETIPVELWKEGNLIKRYYFSISEKTSWSYLLKKVENIFSNTRPWFNNYEVYVGAKKECISINCFCPERQPFSVGYSIPDIRYTEI
jgi:hypothetical protein